MTQTSQHKGEGLRVLAAAIPFLLSLGLLGIAAQSGMALTFAIGWPIIQIAGYFVTIRKAKGDMRHPLVTAQIVLHWLVLALLIAVIAGAS
ncbi:MAG: pyridoxal phosphate biosynthetic protein [Erythrobacter sp.]